MTLEQYTVMATPLAVVAGCHAKQLVGDDTLTLGVGELRIKPFASFAKALVLTVGDGFALDIEPGTIVGTRGDRSYLISKKTADGGAPLQVELAFGAEVTEQSLTQFESTLVAHGYLLTGIQADADSLSRSVQEWLAPKADALTADKGSNADGVKFSDAAHKTAETAESGSQKVAEGVGAIAGFLQQSAQRVGAFIGEKLGTPEQVGPTREALRDGVQATAIATGGIGDAAVHAATSAHEAALQSVDAAAGPEARKMTAHGTATTKNVGSVGALAAIETSALTHGIEAGVGALQTTDAAGAPVTAGERSASSAAPSKKATAAKRPDTRPQFVDGDDGPTKPFPIRIKGEVIRGFGRGSKELGIPTANISEDAIPDLIEHADSGIYYGLAQVDVAATAADAASGEHAQEDGAVHPMVMSVGWNPYYDNNRRSCEVHVCRDFGGRDFYNKHIAVLVLGYIRPEYDYSGVDALVADIREDIQVCERSLKRKAYAGFVNDPVFKPS